MSLKDPQNIQEFLFALKRFAAWFFPSLFGVATKLAYESRFRKLSFWGYAVPSLVIACFFGWACDKLCNNWDVFPNLRGVLVALSALGSDAALKFFFKNDQNIFKALLVKLFNIKVDDVNNTGVDNQSKDENGNTGN